MRRARHRLSRDLLLAARTPPIVDVEVLHEHGAPIRLHDGCTLYRPELHGLPGAARV